MYSWNRMIRDQNPPKQIIERKCVECFWKQVVETKCVEFFQHFWKDSNTGVLVWCTVGSKSRGDIKLRFPTLRSSVGRRSLFKNNELFCSQLQTQLRAAETPKYLLLTALFLNEKRANTSIVLRRNTKLLYTNQPTLAKLVCWFSHSKNVQNRE